MSEPSWDEFKEQTLAKIVPSDDQYDAVCARLFTTPDGKLLLAELRKSLFDGPFNPLGDERALRVRAAQQHLVRGFELARDRGLIAMSRPKN